MDCLCPITITEKGNRMAKQKYALNPGERIVFKTSNVRHGFWGAYTHALTITNQSVILEKYGVLNNFKGIERFDFSIIEQAIQGKATNGEKQLELYIGGRVEDFALQSGDENEMRVLVMAINDQMGPDAEYYDFDYYQSLVTDAKDADRILKLREKAQEENPVSGGTELEIAGAAAKNFFLSGDFSAKGISRAVTKATSKQKKKSLISGMMDEFLDDLGVRDIQDEFTEMGNEFREGFGLKPKMTYAEKKELAALEEKQRKQEIQRQKEAAFINRAAQQKAKIDALKGKQAVGATQNAKMSVKEQMELLQQIKSLLDAGVLTQEEFEKKKQEILNG